jgi:hypothetical protein
VLAAKAELRYLIVPQYTAGGQYPLSFAAALTREVGWLVQLGWVKPCDWLVVGLVVVVELFSKKRNWICRRTSTNWYTTLPQITDCRSVTTTV